jgi:hypothetical protein
MCMCDAYINLFSEIYVCCIYMNCNLLIYMLAIWASSEKQPFKKKIFNNGSDRKPLQKII